MTATRADPDARITGGEAPYHEMDPSCWNTDKDPALTEATSAYLNRPCRRATEVALDKARAALTLIEAMGGKTLIMATDDPHERSAYSLGAHRAFAQAADIAADALADIATLSGGR